MESAEDYVNVRLSRELASQLRKLMDVGDTYDSVIRRLLEHYRSGVGEERERREREEGEEK